MTDIEQLRKQHDQAQGVVDQRMIAGPGSSVSNVLQIGNLLLPPGEKAAQAALDFLKGLTRGSTTSLTADGIQKLLTLVKRRWVDEVLDKGLLLGNPSAEIAFSDVDKPGTRASLHSLTQIAKESNYSLLILGDAGAGKTTALLLFLREILSVNQPDAALLPAVFSLRNWTSKSRDFEKWLRSQLFEAHTKSAQTLLIEF
jgi:hypothetical protein